MKFIKVFLSLVLLFGGRLFAQTYTTDEYNPYTHLPSIGSPSPTAAALGAYANYPVGNFTGVPQIQIPIYEINEGGYKLPINLSYNASGIKVDDIASWVGLGWSLNAGGLITREVEGGADDVNGGRGAPNSLGSQFGPTGFLFYNYNVTVATASTPYQLSGFNSAGTNSIYRQLNGLRYADVDTEPDVFYFNFNGHVGKFVFSQGTDPNTNIGTVDPAQHKIQLIPYQDLKISYAMSSNWITSFTVVDEDGNTYLFASTESVFRLSQESTFESSRVNTSEMNCATGWFLTKITTVNGKVINFNYTVENYSSNLPTTYEKRGFYAGVNPGIVQYSTTSYSNNDFSGLRLSSIVGDDFEVDFYAGQARQDLINTNALTSIKVSLKDPEGNMTQVKQFNLGYSYLQSPNAPANNGSTNNDYVRLILNSVQEVAADGILIKPPYQFGYNNTISLPQRLSPQQDIWGYFNKNGASAATAVIPTVYVYPSLAGTGVGRFSIYPLNTSASYFTISGADRTTNATAVLSGTLNSITYPTGGSTTFLFEPNQFLDTFNSNVTGGGLRLKQSTDYDGISHNNDIIKQYTYTLPANSSQSSGVLFNMPIFAYTENFVDYWSGTTQTQISPYVAWPNGNVDDPSTINYYYHNLVIGNVPQYTMSGFDGNILGYSAITESINGNGKTVRIYSTPGRYGELSDGPGNGTCTIASEGYCDNLFVPQQPTFAPLSFDQTQITSPNGQTTDPTPIYPDLTGIDYAQSYALPFAPSINYDWNRGWLMSETQYDNSGNMVLQKNNTYKIYSTQNAGPLYVYGLRFRLMQNYLLANSDYAQHEWQESDYPMYSHYDRYPVITNIAKQLSNETVKTYSTGGTGTFTTATTNYTYSNNCFKPSLVERVLSNGDLLDKHISYPPDFTTLDANTTDIHAYGLYNAQQQHIVNPIVETYTIRKKADGTNPRITEAYLATFKINTPSSNQPLPDVIYRSESLGPISNFSPATINDAGVTKDASYTPFLSFDVYDGLGYVKLDHLAGGIDSTYIYDYNKQYLVAKVIGAGTSDVAYTSFEADGGESNWVISPGAIVTDPTAPTGTHAYSLSSTYSIDCSGLNSGLTYVVSYWAKNQVGPLTITNGSSVLSSQAVTGPTVNGWTFFSHTVSGTANIGLSGSCYVDEVRLFPLGAKMVNFTYDAGGNLTSSGDVKGELTHYEFDTFQRLINVKDKDGNIIKHTDYHYQGQ